MKLSPQGTITALMHKGIYELDYNAKVLWKMPKNAAKHPDSVEYYHHEFTRLANGHYMVLGDEKFEWEKPISPDSNFVLAPDAKPLTGTMPLKTITFGTIVEYDQNNAVVWAWRSSDYFRNADACFFKVPQGVVDVHENAFFFDEKKKLIYVSFKGINRVLAVTYPEGKVSDVYGPIYTPGGMSDANEHINTFFCGQHSCRISHDGHLYLFNNNNCRPGAWPTIVMLRQTGNKMERVWEYECNIDYVGIKFPKPYIFPIGGNVFELPDGSFLVSMSGPTSCTFIVNKNKQILWSVVSEKRMGNANQWMPMISYRASMVTRKELEQLIWKAEKK